MPQNQQFFVTVLLVEVIAWLIGTIFFAIGNYFIAKRLGKSKAAWVILTLIPGVNFIFLYYMIYQIIYGILDRLPGPGRAVREEF